ncbi:ABC transporter ATP-binding protein [Clostridium sp.]|uniref:ABC transporter ATP-binding protein n=1 Tax=Clostridium sp. TaxID=1506 RepID=UPI0026230C58|nr:ABC transporter ATP-binding protein [Clostridium sp.]
MKKLLYYMNPFKKEFILGPFFKLIEAILELFIPIVMAKIIDRGIYNKDIPYIFKMGGVLILLGGIGLAFALVCQYYASLASQGIGTNLRGSLFKHINSLSHKELDNIGTPTLITRLTNDINLVQSGFAMLIRLGTRSPFIIIGSTIMALSLDFHLSIIFIITIPLIVLVIGTIMKKSIPMYKVIQKKLDTISLITRESVEGVRVVKAFSKEEAEIKRFDEANKEFVNKTIGVLKISSLLNPLTSIIMNFAIVLLLHFGAIRVNSGSLTQGEIIALINYITQIMLALVVLSQLIIILTKGYTSFNRVTDILNIDSTINEDNNAKPLPKADINPIIEFDNVSFSYDDNNEYALKDIDLIINKNENIGIIGGTGSGKSTLVNLIPRFYDPTKGIIKIKGLNIKELSIKELRDLIGIVPQKAVLFSGTIRENLEWGKSNPKEEYIKKALNISMSSEFINSFEDGLDSNVLKGGKNLSGGQKQRLTIARALIKEPDILILDDSLSALDFVTDSKLRKALKEDVTNTTIITISQRASSIKNSDKIIVMDNGEIKDIGSHSYLLENCEIYQEICSSQNCL